MNEVKIFTRRATACNLNIKEWRESFSRFPLMCFNETGNYVQECGKRGRQIRSTDLPIAFEPRYNIHETIRKFATAGMRESPIVSIFSLFTTKNSRQKQNNLARTVITIFRAKFIWWSHRLLQMTNHNTRTNKYLQNTTKDSEKKYR